MIQTLKKWKSKNRMKQLIKKILTVSNAKKRCGSSLHFYKITSNDAFTIYIPHLDSSSSFPFPFEPWGNQWIAEEFWWGGTSCSSLSWSVCLVGVSSCRKLKWCRRYSFSGTPKLMLETTTTFSFPLPRLIFLTTALIFRPRKQPEDILMARMQQIFWVSIYIFTYRSHFPPMA